MQFLRVGTSGIRGKVSEGLTPQNVINYVSAFGSYLDGRQVVIGRDTRISSNMFYNAALTALVSCGCEVVELDLCTAAELSFMIVEMKAAGGIYIGGGHHQADWNAVLPFGENGANFNELQAQELLDIYHSNDFRIVSWDEIGKIVSCGNWRERYIDYLLKFIDIDLIKAKKLRVVLDYCNGPGSISALLLKERTGLDFLVVNLSKSGVLPHNPEPRPSSAFQVQTLVQSMESDFGVVFSSDASRMSLVSNTGARLSEECTYPLLLDYLLEKNNYKGCVVTNSCSSRMIENVVKRHGAELIYCSTGQSYVVDKMNESGAIFGGEGSGGFCYGGALPIYDGLLSALFLMEAVSVGGKSIDSMWCALPRYYIKKRSIFCLYGKSQNLVKSLKEYFPSARVSEQDGILLEWADGWLHLRQSRTEPLFRVIVEHNDEEEAEEIDFQVRAILERLVIL